MQPETVLLFFLPFCQESFTPTTFYSRNLCRKKTLLGLHQKPFCTNNKPYAKQQKNNRKGFTPQSLYSRNTYQTYQTPFTPEPILHKKHQKTLYAKNRFAGRLLTSHFSPEYTTPETWRNSTTSELFLHHGFQMGGFRVRVPDSFKDSLPKTFGGKKKNSKKS